MAYWSEICGTAGQIILLSENVKYPQYLVKQFIEKLIVSFHEFFLAWRLIFKIYEHHNKISPIFLF